MIFFFLWIYFFFSFFVHGSVTVKPLTGGTQGSASTGGGEFYFFIQYPQSPALIPPAFIPWGEPLDISKTFWDGSQDSLLSDVFELQISSDTLFSSSPQTFYGVTLQTVPDITSHPIHFLPLVTRDHQLCNDSICQGKNYISSSAHQGKDVYYVARYFPQTQKTISIGFYPRDMCSDYYTLSGTNASGCDQGHVFFPADQTPTTLLLSVKIFSLSSQDASALPTDGNDHPTPLDQTSSPVKYIFQTSSPQIRCDLLSDNDFTLGDQSVVWNPSHLGLLTETLPPARVVIVGQENADPLINQNYQSNSFFSSVESSLTRSRLTGLKNSSPTELIRYSFSFLVQDAAGVLAPPHDDFEDSAHSSCILRDISVSQINGFLKKNQCFIATAVFGSQDAFPVLLLKKYRDLFLMRFALGKKMISYYYQVAPSVTEWMDHNPVKRLFLGMMLLPFLLFSFIFFYPLMSWITFLIGYSLFFIISLKIKKQKIKK